jgi:hypothetical protein
MLKPRDLKKILRDWIQVRQGPTVLSLDTGDLIEDGTGLYLMPAETAVSVRGSLPGARDVGQALYEARNSRHARRSVASDRGRGVPVLYGIPGPDEDEWLVGIGTLVGEPTLSRWPALRAKVVSLGGD